MATSADLIMADSPANGASDPFTTTPGHSGTMRYANFDTADFSLYTSASPSHARRALEAHLKDTDRRIQDASKLGTTLLQQRKELSARLKDVQDLDKDNEVPDSLRKKLAELEKEYNEVGKESARAFLPKSRNVSEGADKAVLSASGRESPTKLSAPSRKQRNQPANRVHDIEFATEISTSLLAQVRQLQAALAEKDDALRATNSHKAELETEYDTIVQRVRRLDESEQKYKDENWNLETKLQELEASMKEVSDREHRMTQSFKTAEFDKTNAQRDLDNLKLSHERLNEEHALIKKQNEGDIHGLRRDLTSHQSERETLQRKIEELTAQNTELAKAVSYRFNQPSQSSDREFVTADEEENDADVTPDHSEPVSPVKGTPRHGMLESETLKSSLNHAHRMIQNLKNNIHREKTEKIELKRMLQDARDELETRRGDGGAAVKKRRSEPQFKKPARPDKLGATRMGTTEFLEDDDWEDEGARTPSKSTFGGLDAVAAMGHDPESTDSFETANERENTTETEAFETGNEGMAGDDSDELTETEGTVQRTGTVRQSTAALANARAGTRTSFFSTASTSGDEAEDNDAVHTPSQSQQPRYRLRMARGGRRPDRVGELITDSPGAQSNHSPNSSFGGTPRPAGQSLGDELDALDQDSVEGTPSRMAESLEATPETQRHVSADPDTPRTMESPFRESTDSRRIVSAIHAPILAPPKPPMVDAGVMTEPWKPEPAAAIPAAVPAVAAEAETGKATAEKPSLRDRAGEVVGGALAGFGLGRLGRGKDKDDGFSDSAAEQTKSGPGLLWGGVDHTPDSAESVVRPAGGAELATQNTLAAPESASPLLSFSSIEFQTFEPTPAPIVEPTPAVIAPVPTLDRSAGTAATHTIPGTEAAPPGIGFFSTAAGAENDGVVAEKALGDVDIKKSRAPLGEIQPNVVQNSPATTVARQVLSSRVPMADEGVQTTVSGDDIDKMLRAKIRQAVDTSSSPSRAPRRSFEGGINEPVSPKVPRRPSSSGSMRKTAADMPPPLPENSELKIAQAQKVPSSSMGPPGVPASAYRQNQRPRTPAERANERSSRDGTTPRPFRTARGQIGSPAGTSRRSSVSSFASELDERFNARGQFMYPTDVEPATDPRMIQAITQTMIGEYLWKYTRKAGRSETSSTRHRRFFWVHPYTRTLYWSEQDPSTAGKNMLKGKSVAIEAVRVVTDDNTMPPGLHRKSIVVITPGREIVFTAPTGQRHETWFNALSYLLLRSDREKQEAADAFDQNERNEFGPGFGFRRSISKMTGRDRSNSRMSLSSYNSRTTRTSSPQRGGTGGQPSSRGGPSPTPNAVVEASTTNSRQNDTVRQSSGPFSSITSRFRPGSSHRASTNNTKRGRSSVSLGRRAGDPAEIYDASVVADSAEDLRAVIERQEREADRLENVRACCDGQHDVGSLTTRHGHGRASFGNRLSHTHAHPPAQDSTRSRA